MGTKTSARLSEDSLSASTAQVVIDEACANAITHAGATFITVSVSSGPHELEITVTNDGEAPRVNSETGLGTALLDDVALRWHLDSQPEAVSQRQECSFLVRQRGLLERQEMVLPW